MTPIDQYLTAAEGLVAHVRAQSPLIEQAAAWCADTIAAGRMVAQGTVEVVIGSMAQPGAVRVRTPHVDQLAVELRTHHAVLDYPGEDQLVVRGVDAATVGRAALAARAELHELVTETPDLEQVFLQLTHAKAGIR